MPQQFLYGSQICSLLQQVGGKRMAKHVYMYPVLDSGTAGGFFQYLYQRTCGILFSGCLSLEQSFLRTVLLEIFPQFLQQFFRQQRIPAFPSFAHDAYKHPFAYDVLRGEVQQLAPP